MMKIFRIIVIFCGFLQSANAWCAISSNSTVQASDITQIQDDLDAKRATAPCGSLGPYSWTLPRPALGDVVRAQHFIDIADALRAAPFNYAAALPNFAAGAPITAADVNALKAAVTAATCGGASYYYCATSASCASAAYASLAACQAANPGKTCYQDPNGMASCLATAPTECPAPATCGNGVCETGENCRNCNKLYNHGAGAYAGLPGDCWPGTNGPSAPGTCIDYGLKAEDVVKPDGTECEIRRSPNSEFYNPCACDNSCMREGGGPCEYGPSFAGQIHFHYFQGAPYNANAAAMTIINGTALTNTCCGSACTTYCSPACGGGNFDSVGGCCVPGTTFATLSDCMSAGGKAPDGAACNGDGDCCGGNCRPCGICSDTSGCTASWPQNSCGSATGTDNCGDPCGLFIDNCNSDTECCDDGSCAPTASGGCAGAGLPPGPTSPVAPVSPAAPAGPATPATPATPAAPGS